MILICAAAANAAQVPKGLWEWEPGGRVAAVTSLANLGLARGLIVCKRKCAPHSIRILAATPERMELT
jgi:hypothetical protein